MKIVKVMKKNKNDILDEVFGDNVKEIYFERDEVYKKILSIDLLNF